VATGWSPQPRPVPRRAASWAARWVVLSHAGLSGEDAHEIAECLRRGATLVAARVPEADRSQYEAILDQGRSMCRCVSLLIGKPDGRRMIPMPRPLRRRNAARPQAIIPASARCGGLITGARQRRQFIAPGACPAIRPLQCTRRKMRCQDRPACSTASTNPSAGRPAVIAMVSSLMARSRLAA